MLRHLSQPPIIREEKSFQEKPSYTCPTFFYSSNMWFIVNTDRFQEQKTKEFLDTTYPGIIRQVYLPLCRMKTVGSDGEERVRFQPLIFGLLFVKVDSVEALKGILTYWGYFVYMEKVRDLATGLQTKARQVSSAHLLCKDVKELDQATIIRKATIPDEDMERFIYFSDKIADGIEGLSIVDRRYSDLILVNDTIRILSGPMAGWVGVVKQVKHRGKKDCRLFVRFGSNHCLNISNIRQYDMQVEHEATKGPKAEAVGAWRAIDQMVGYLQAQKPSGNAQETLRHLFKDYLKKLQVYRNLHMSDLAYSNKQDREKAAWQQEVIEKLDRSMRSNFRILADYFKTDNATLEKGLLELIPDAVLRPFLTPTSGVSIPEGQDYVVLCHNGIVEFVLRCNLREYFRLEDGDAGKAAPVVDEDYEYYAHIGLLRYGGAKIKLITSWGGFYDKYVSLSEDEREKFLSDLQARKYSRMLHLFTQSEYKVEKAHGIGGFSLDTDIAYTGDAEEMGRKVNEFLTLNPSLFAQLAAAAVEMWQGTRLLVWRQLLQRYVLLHKVPVIDQNEK